MLTFFGKNIFGLPDCCIVEYEVMLLTLVNTIIFYLKKEETTP